MQDIVLEPFAGDVFAQSPEQTARFSAYWGGMSILSMAVALIITRRMARITHSAFGWLGTMLLTVAFAFFGIAALTKDAALLTPGLLLMGAGLGVWNVGTLGLMMDFSPAGRAGAFMGIWTVIVTLARGGGRVGGWPVARCLVGGGAAAGEGIRQYLPV